MNEKKIIIEAPDGNRFECNVPANTRVDILAADFFEEMNWPSRDSYGRGQRAVVELVNSGSDTSTRLRGAQTLEDDEIKEGAVLRIFPESIAGMNIDQRRRIIALKKDHKEMLNLAENASQITFETNRKDTPDIYTIKFNIDSFKSAPVKTNEKPELISDHIVMIKLHATYPRDKPILRWVTPIFHPNISEDGAVCLGQLEYRYLPGFGIARIVAMLEELIRWRNYGLAEPFNQEAASWAFDKNNWKYIEEIGGIRPSTNLVPYRDLINPENWGNTMNENSIFKGIEQPIYWKILWEQEKHRNKITFKHLN